LSVPFPGPEAPLVTVIQVALLIEPQAQVDVTVTLPVEPPAPALTVPGAIVDVPHTDVSANVFDTVLDEDPPGPFAETRAS
jgi:hypothetical protein